MIADRQSEQGSWVARKMAVLGVGALGLRHFVEALQAMHLAVPERVFDLVVGFGEHQRAVVLAQDRRAEQLVAMGNAVRGLRHDVVLDHVEQAVDQRNVGHGQLASGRWIS